MAAIANQIGQQQLTVSGTPVGITRPPVTTGQLIDEFGQVIRKSVVRLFVTVHEQPVRWRADGTDPTGAAEDNLLYPGDRLDWSDPSQDWRGPIEQLRFIADVDAEGDAVLEIAMFG